MNKFIRCIMKFAVVCCSVLLTLLIGIAALLIFAPGVLLKILYYAAVIACLIGAVYILFGLIGTVFVCILAKRRYRRLYKK